MLHQAHSGFAVLEAVIWSPNNWRSGFGGILLDARWLRSGFEAARASTHRIRSGFGEAKMSVRACSGCEVASEQPFRVHSAFEVHSGFEVPSEQPFRAHSGFESGTTGSCAWLRSGYRAAISST